MAAAAEEELSAMQSGEEQILPPSPQRAAEEKCAALRARHGSLGDGPERRRMGRALRRVTRRIRGMRTRERFRRGDKGEKRDSKLRALGRGGSGRSELMA